MQLIPLLDAVRDWLAATGVPEAWRDRLVKPGWNQGALAALNLASLVAQARQQELEGALPSSQESPRPRM